MSSNGSSRRRLRLAAIALGCIGLLGSTLRVPSEAQVTTNITSTAGAGNLGTIVIPGGATTTITGGTRPGNGTNLFHSFGQFTVGTGNTANFFNETHLSTTNILSRVTGGNPSNIFGTIQTTGFPGANLFLINPAGVVFGPTAQLHVEGSFHVSTADYLRLADGVRFTAVPGPQDALLSTAPVAAFGFLSNNPAAISVQGSVLVMPPGQTLSLIGGDIQALGGQVSAPAGLIQLASVASTGEVFLGVPGLSLDPLNVSSFSRLGRTDIQLSALDVSGTLEAPVGGAILIRSGRLVMDNAALLSNTVALSGGPISIASQTIEMNGGLIQTATLGPGAAGDLLIATGTLTLTEGALITSNTFGTGQGGKLTVAAGESLMLLGETPGPVTIGGVFLSHLPSGISTVAFADGQGGQIRVSTPTLAMQKGVILAETFGTGNAGEIFVNAGKLVLTDGAQIAASSSGSSGKGGNVMVRATDSITIDGNRTDVFLGAGRPVINGPSGFFTNADGMGDGGVISVSSPILTIGDGQAGGQIAAQTFGPANAGSILVEVGSLTLANGALISGATLGAGQGGNVTVTATNSISISGRHPGSFGVGSLIFNNTQSGIVSLAFAEGKAGRISVSTANLSLHDEGLISAATGGAGAAGDVVVNSGTLSLTRGGQISSSSGVRVGDQFLFGPGPGGIITVNTGSALISDPGSGVLTSSAGDGAGGNIEFRAGSLQMTNGGVISARSAGQGNAGNISLTATDFLKLTNSFITTEALQAAGGDITIHVGSLVSLLHSRITATVLTQTGNGGNITIDPPKVILNDSQIIAKAFAGHGGKITIDTDLFLASPESVIDASSSFGLNGTVSIQSPVQNLSGTLSPLPSSLLKIAPLTSACAARAQGGSMSSFTVAGRDGVPAEPGGLLPSPLSEPARPIESEQPALGSNEPGMPIPILLAMSGPAIRTLCSSPTP